MTGKLFRIMVRNIRLNTPALRPGLSVDERHRLVGVFAQALIGPVACKTVRRKRGGK
jgi:hypothetical protein